MSSTTITIKPNNHRIYQCPNDKKLELLNKIISENENLNILIACSCNAYEIEDGVTDKRVTIMEDKEIVQSRELSCDMLISYDLPIKAIVYMARVAKATEKAIFLVDENEQKGLHDIEMLLGRAIKQESIDGFLYPVVVKKKANPNPSPKKLTQEQIKEEAKKRYEKVTGEPKERKKDFKKIESSKKWDKKKKEENKFLGYDENGKAKFSGKSGERNHRYDGSVKEKYNTPKKVGKKINIKARRPLDTDKDS
jgi:superfamily II DNA/RNA helicase